MNSTNNCIDLNTASDAAAKYYDATVLQLCGWYEDNSIGGLNGCAQGMVDEDPEFVLGLTLNLQLNLMGALRTPRFDETLKKKIELLNKLIERKGKLVNEHELLHAEVVNLWSKNELRKSARVLERIVTLYPEDVAALKMIQDVNFFLGTALPMRNSLASSLPRMSDKNPLKGYVHGMFSFALEESNQYEESQIEALKALNLIPIDTWAIHNYAHCLEMQGLSEEGSKWMNDRKPDWKQCQTLACHQYWHSALFHINNNQFDEAVALLDQEVLTRCVQGSSALDMHDASSMMYRLELVDMFNQVQQNDPDQMRKRWSGIYTMTEPHKMDHLSGFHDAHYLMSFLGMNDLKLAREFIDSIDGAPELREGANLVKPLLEAMYQFKLGAFDKCVDLLADIRFDIIRIGGSHAQRDVFEQLLIVAALKSDKPSHNKLGERMLVEREFFHKKKTVQTELLARQQRSSI